MLGILKVDIKNNKIIFASLLLAISIFTLCLYFGLYEIRFFNDALEAKKLSSQNTNFLKWIELIYPLIFTSFIIKIFSDSHSRETIAFSLSLPISNFKFLICRFFLWTLIFFLLFYPSISFFKGAVINELGYDFLPVWGFHTYTLINMVVLSTYVLFIQIILGQYYYALGCLFLYVLFDYFSEGRFLKNFTLHPLSFKAFSDYEFIQNRITLIAIALVLIILIYLLLEKSNMFRKNIW